MTWVKLCAVDALPEGGAQRLQAEPPISVFHTDGAFFAIDDTCTHEDASLADGWIEGATVECPLHQARFCLRTGEALSPPAYVPVRTYVVKVEHGVIYVDVPDAH